MSLSRPNIIPWPPILLSATIAGGWLLQRVWPLMWPGMDDLPARMVGWAFGLLGVALMTWSIWTLQAHKTTVMPHKPASQLVTDGPYRWRRNPIYLADVFLLLALGEVTKNIWFVLGAVAFAVLVTWLAILPEENHLEAKFGDIYRDYKARTRRWI